MCSVFFLVLDYTVQSTEVSQNDVTYCKQLHWLIVGVEMKYWRQIGYNFPILIITAAIWKTEII